MGIGSIFQENHRMHREEIIVSGVDPRGYLEFPGRLLISAT
jgi:hypothetical protein